MHAPTHERRPGRGDRRPPADATGAAYPPARAERYHRIPGVHPSVALAHWRVLCSGDNQDLVGEFPNNYLGSWADRLELLETLRDDMSLAGIAEAEARLQALEASGELALAFDNHGTHVFIAPGKVNTRAIN